MIYVLIGNDLRKKNDYIKEISNEREIVVLSLDKVSKELIINYAESLSLFNLSPVIVVENIISSKEVSFSAKELEVLEKSETIFCFSEDKISAVNQNKYKKNSQIKFFEEKEVKKSTKFDSFIITNAFERKDKIKTWIFYHQAIKNGIEPEAISGILFWKIKTMLLNGSRIFNEKELKEQASLVVSLHHRAHRGDIDFIVGLEQFILNSLS